MLTQIYADESLKNHTVLKTLGKARVPGRGSLVAIRSQAGDNREAVLLSDINLPTTEAILYIRSPIWVFKWLDVEEGSRVLLEEVREASNEVVERISELSDARGPRNINLYFISQLSYRHWDEMSSITAGNQGPFADPSRWNNAWPTGMSAEALASMLPTLLKDTPLFNGRAIAVTALQMTFLFRVEFEGGGVWCVGANFLQSKVTARASFAITIPTFPSSSAAWPSTRTKIDGEEQRTSTSALPLTPSNNTELDTLLTLIRRHGEGRWQGPGCVVVCGGPGQGKSTLASALHCSLLGGSAGSRVISISSEDILDGAAASSTSSGSSSSDEMASTPAMALDSLLEEVDRLNGPTAPNTGEACEARHQILIIDDVHLLLFAPLLAHQSDGDTAISAVIATLRRYSYSTQARVAAVAQRLRILLHSTRNAGNLERPVFVVGFSSVDVRQLPLGCMGCPAFEYARSLSGLRGADRAVVLEWAMKREGYSSLALESDSGGGGDNREGADVCYKTLLSRAAGVLSGYSPADIVRVVQKARVIDEEFEEVSHEVALGRLSEDAHAQDCSGRDNSKMASLTWTSLLRASGATTPSALLVNDPSSGLGSDEGGAPRADGGYTLSWDDLCAPPRVRNLLTTRLFRDPSSDMPESRSGASLRRAVRGGLASGAVLYGPSGCGKTFLGTILCSQARLMGFSHLRRSGTELLSKYFGGSEERVREMFHAARRAAPCLLFIDDFDVVSARRGTGNDGGAGGGDVAGRILSTFLNEIDGIHQVVSSNDEEKGEEDKRRVVVVVAAPSLQCLDEALLRPGRLQLHVELPCPSLEETVAFLDKRLSNVPGGKDIDTRELAGALHARSSSGTDAGVGSGKVSVGDVVHTVDKAVRNAIRRTIEQLKNNGGVALEGDDPLIGAAMEARDFELLRNAPAPPMPSPSPFVFTPLN